MQDGPRFRLPEKEGFIEQLSIDCVIFGYRDRSLHVLVPKLNFRGGLSTLPGGFVRQDESIDEAALNILKGRTGIEKIYLEQFQVFGDLERSTGPFMRDIVRENAERHGENAGEVAWLTRRFVSIGYYALVNIAKVVPVKSEIDDSIDWHPLEALPAMVMDHNKIVAEALKALRNDLDRKLIGFNLLPERFTMQELRELYETVYDRAFTRSNFQRRILDLGVLERLEKKFTGAANKAPYLYRFILPDQG
ncbi:NUDIX domain-containing protein [Neolewinella lacunae]|uniref:NUDIX hydrolase n=1 Tax=Neolewinella lacunae TaxID=1517758 RepID=A0A923T7E4_9BACT|nr:NUDIX domain-containing protein [Neolewinella lacunae]MBC6993476.1 NUDIX hydrolase [Neolewinella lacunae]MDN3636248.1 NUDIX domain-containing protein [Neolewinella lacunae]